MAENGDELFARVFEHRRVSERGFDEALVDSLVEPRDVIEAVTLCPRVKPENRGPQRAILGDELLEVEPGRQTFGRVLMADSCERSPLRKPVRLVGLFRGALWSAHVADHRGEELRGVVAEGFVAHPVRPRQQRARKAHPLFDDGGVVLSDEVPEPHGRPSSSETHPTRLSSRDGSAIGELG